MQNVSRRYKEMMKRKWINQLCHMRVTIGVINQEAQASARVAGNEYEYYSNCYKPLNNYVVNEGELYAACDEDYTSIDRGMFFLPRDKELAVLNQGIVTTQLLGTITIEFPVPYDIKGLTIEFGKAYPVDFAIQTDQNTVMITQNESGKFVTDKVFTQVTYLKIIPSKMKNGSNRLRIHQITMGIGIYFSGHEIKSAVKQEFVSPISEELPTLDFSLTVENRNRKFDIENYTSTVNFLEQGQQVEALYGQGLDDGSIEWMPGIKLSLKEWEVDDDEMSFSAADQLSDLSDTYYRGIYRSEGISLYDLALDVFNDAGVDLRKVWLDPYLKDVVINNPMPAVTHKEALQLIANAGRCVLSQGRDGSIYLKSSFKQEMTVETGSAAYFSRPQDILNGQAKSAYASVSMDYTQIDSVFFLPRENDSMQILDTGYISEQIADAQGLFSQNPTITVLTEAAYKCFGLTLEFGNNWPEELVILAYYENELKEEYTVTEINRVTVISHEFAEWDRMTIEFRKGKPYNRIVLDNIIFGESTDYVLEYGTELRKAPKGKQLQKVKEVQIMRTLYSKGQVSDVELAREEISITAADNQYTFYFSKPSYGFSCALVSPAEGQNIQIISYSSYYVTVQVTGVEGPIEVVISGREYIQTYAKVNRQLNVSGTQEVWENPLVSDLQHAIKLADWIGDYLKADKEYEIPYRGDARIDGNDLAFLENKYVDDMQVRIYKHSLTYNGSLTGTIMARRVE